MPKRLHDVQYHVLLFAEGASRGPGTVKAELTPGVLNLRWHQALNGAGTCAFTMVRGNRALADISYMRDHVKVYRESAVGTKCVFAGKVIRPSRAQADTIVSCWDYAAFLQRSRTGYKVLYPGKTIGTIVSAEWTLAKGASDSPLAFVATGTIQDPTVLGGSTAIVTNATFGVNDFDRLWTFYTLAEMSMANTDNTVVFEITREPPHTFNFWKNKGGNQYGYALYHPGNLMELALDPAFDMIQNDLATVIVDPLTGVKSEYTVSDASSIGTYGRLQSAVTIRTLYGLQSSSNQTDQQKAALDRLLTQSIKVPKMGNWFTRQNSVQPFDGWDLGDKLPVVIKGDGGTGYDVDAMQQVIGIAGAWTPGAGEMLQVATR